MLILRAKSMSAASTAAPCPVHRPRRANDRLLPFSRMKSYGARDSPSPIAGSLPFTGLLSTKCSRPSLHGQRVVTTLLDRVREVTASSSRRRSSTLSASWPATWPTSSITPPPPPARRRQPGYRTQRQSRKPLQARQPLPQRKADRSHRKLGTEDLRPQAQPADLHAASLIAAKNPSAPGSTPCLARLLGNRRAIGRGLRHHRRPRAAPDLLVTPRSASCSSTSPLSALQAFH